MLSYLFDITKGKKSYRSFDHVNSEKKSANRQTIVDEAADEAFIKQSTSNPTASYQHTKDLLDFSLVNQQHEGQRCRLVRLNIDDALDAVATIRRSSSSVRTRSTVMLLSPTTRLLIGTSLLFLVDSYELAVIGFLSKALVNSPKITSYQNEQLLAVAGVAGAMTGAIVLGGWASRWAGRQRVTQIVAVVITLFAISTALLPPTNIHNMEKEVYVVQGLLLSRFLVGFGLGSITVPYDLLAEWLPNYIPQPRRRIFWRRGQVLLLVHASWSIGSLLSFALLQTQTVLSPEKGRLSGIELWWCTVPALLATAVFLFHCGNTTTSQWESPRFLLAQGRGPEAMQVMQCAAQPCLEHSHAASMLFPPDDEVTVVLYSNEDPQELPNQQQQQQFGIVADENNIFSWGWLKLASALLFTYFGQAFCYRGTADMLVSTFAEDQHPQTYQAALSAAAELLGLVLVALLLERWGRVPTQMAAYAVAALASLTTAVWFSVPTLENGRVLIVLALLTRSVVFAGGCVTWVSTTEVLRTSVRTTGHALLAGMAGRLGTFAGEMVFPSILSSDDADDDSSSIPIQALVVFVVSLLVCFAAGDIPETRGQEMGRSYSLLGQTERIVRANRR